MASMFRILAIAALIAAGCASDPTAKVCPTTGILCPGDMICAAAQPVCLTTSCGNGVRDGNEQCEDGNIIDGDGCSSLCRTEECGNNVLDPGESCDDGNTTGGDGCSATCQSKEGCGNGVTDLGEMCDDGNLVNGDGCTGTPQTVSDGMGGTMTSPEPCMSREICGNGIKDFQVGEVCDDGNTISGDGCNSDCRSGEGCGNGIVDPGEMCDDGDSDDHDRCRNNCTTAMCGDGVVETTNNVEKCDAGDPLNPGPKETMGCNLDCTLRTCGDGKVNQTAGEQCDNGVGQNVDTNNCTALCMLNVCGDGKVDMQDPVKEGCDDANTNNFDGCSNACVSATCGNMTVDVGEQCDDGNMDADDACVACATAVCGDGHKRAGVEDCDDNNKINGDGCSSTCRLEGCGNGILDPLEQCDDGNAINTDACVTGCRNAVCGDTFVRMGVEQCDDGNLINGDMCSGSCRSEGCGNGTLDPGEQCDDGQMPPVGGDGCSATCQLEHCGDGRIDVGEACDGTGTLTMPGVGGETVNCNIDCTMRTCGDAKVNSTSGEQCDSGKTGGVNNNKDSADCTAMCKINICTDGHPNTDGPLHIEACDDGNTIATDGCNNACQLASCGNGLVDPMEECDLGALGNSDTGACTLGCKLAKCGDNKVRTGVEQCDGGNAVGGDGCSAICLLEECGNGITDPLDECDDGGGAGRVSGDGCSAACKIEFCGDGIVTAVQGETCDPGTLLVETATCNRDCTGGSPGDIVRCGDGIVNRAFHPAGGPAGTFEQCDDGGTANGDGCSQYCQFERCGNSVLDPGEECDGTLYATVPGNLGPCTSCQVSFCGNGRLEGSEACDAGPNNGDTKACTSTCQLNVCGDGKTLAGTEVCDFGGSNLTTAVPANGACPYGQATCAQCTATCASLTTTTGPYCGDNAQTNGETCDDGNSITESTCPYQSANPSTSNCTICTSGCVPAMRSTGPYCGDSIVNGFEQCDGTQTATCASFGFGFTGGTVSCGASCFYDFGPCEICGDGVKEGSEACDDANRQSGDGCNSTCSSVESGFTCTGSTPTVCTANTVCGNNIREPGEACDNGGGAANDGCNASCIQQAGWNCTGGNGSASVCTTTCGDGIMVGTEACDDGDLPPMGGDGCDASCALEPGYTCVGTAPTTCTINSVQLTVMTAGTGTGTVDSAPPGISGCATTCTASYNYGTDVVLTETAAGTFGSWSGGCMGTGSTCTVHLTTPITVTATFNP